MNYFTCLCILGTFAVLTAHAAPNPLIARMGPASAVTNSAEFAALEDFRSRINPKVPEKSEVKKYIEDAEDSDFYLLTWLREKELDVNEAERMFLNHLNWRALENIDLIHKEQFSQIQKDFPVYSDTVSKKGQPVMEIWFSSWKVKEYVYAGRRQEVLRWLAYFTEMTNRRIYEDDNSKKKKGKGNGQGRAKDREASGALVVVELDNFNVDNQACTTCLQLLDDWLRLYQDNYPRSYQTIYLLNMPASFKIVMDFVSPTMSQSTRDALKYYSNRNEWIGELNSVIDKDQRSERFGGRIVRDNNSETEDKRKGDKKPKDTGLVQVKTATFG